MTGYEFDKDDKAVEKATGRETKCTLKTCENKVKQHQKQSRYIYIDYIDVFSHDIFFDGFALFEMTIQ